MKKHILLLLTTIILLGCQSVKEVDSRWARDNGIGSKLEEKTVVYTIFIDSKSSLFWTGFDIASTKDSLEKVFRWTEQQAKKHGKDLEIIPEYYKAGSALTFKKTSHTIRLPMLLIRTIERINPKWINGLYLSLRKLKNL